MLKELRESLGDTIESYETVYPEIEWRKCCGDYNFSCMGCYFKSPNTELCRLSFPNRIDSFYKRRKEILKFLEEEN